VVRTSEDEALPSGFQFTMMYPGTSVSLVGLKDDGCINPAICGTFDVPPSNLVPQGHVVTTDPTEYEDWAGMGFVIMANLSNTNPLSSAYLDGTGNLVGDPEAGYFVFEMAETVPSNTPVSVTIPFMLLVDGDSFTLSTTLENGQFLVSD